MRPGLEHGTYAAIDGLEIGIEKTAGEGKAAFTIERERAQHRGRKMSECCMLPPNGFAGCF